MGGQAGVFGVGVRVGVTVAFWCRCCEFECFGGLELSERGWESEWSGGVGWRLCSWTIVMF